MGMWTPLLLSLAGLVSANSRGTGIACDIMLDVGTENPPALTKEEIKELKHNAEKEVNGAPQYQPPYMWWASKTAWADDKYTLRSGDGDPASDPTTYTPGMWTDIHLRSNVRYEQLTGLVLYAENSAGAKVGTWSIRPRSGFHKPGDCIVHNNAQPKNYLNTFRFSAPRHTGKVTFKALVKFGLAFPVMDGGFFWPNSQHLTLNEGPPAAGVQSWFEGRPKESCDETCARLGGSCDLDKMLAEGTSKAMYESVFSKVSTCKEPMMAGCSGATPATGDDGCFFHDADCAPPAPTPPPPTPDPDKFKCTSDCGGPNAHIKIGACCTVRDGDPILSAGCKCVESTNDGQDTCYYSGNCVWIDGKDPNATPMPTVAPPPPPMAEKMTCSAKIDWSDEARRLCACTGATPETTPHTPDGPPPAPGPGMNGASSVTGSAALATAFLSTMAMGGSRSGSLGAVAMVAGLMFLPSSQAHNWITSPGRGNEAKENNGYNGFQTKPGPQKVGSRVHTQVGLGQKFPVEWAAGHGFGSYTYIVVLKAEDEKHLGKHEFDLLDDYIDNAPSTNYLSEFGVYHVSDTGHSHGTLDGADVSATYEWAPGLANSVGVRPEGFRQNGFASGNPKVQAKTDTNKVKRASYSSGKYPWIISVSKFNMNYDYPAHSDTTMIEIPNDGKNKPGAYIVQYLWSGYYDIVDVNVLDVKSTDLFGRATTGGVSYNRMDHCDYIRTYPGFKATGCKAMSSMNIAECTGLCGNGCDAIQVMQVNLAPQVRNAGVWSGTEHLPAECPTNSEFVCFAVKGGSAVVGPNYRLSPDPEDHVFYDSCFKRSVGGWAFDQAAPATSLAPPPAGFIFGNECLDCDRMRSIEVLSSEQQPDWEFTDDCVHCNGVGN